MRRTLGLVAAFSIVAVATHASDGVLEINQVCATGPGCAAGDAPGFPVSISAPGSYRLTSNLSVDPTTTAIQVSANSVHVDLGGFAIVGPNDCGEGPTTSCTYADAGGNGIVSTGEATVLRHGSIRGMGSRGVDFSSSKRAVVEDLVVHHNGTVGIAMGIGGVARRVEASNHDDFGIIAETVQDCVVRQNQNGIGGVTNVDRCTVVRNLGVGITSTTVATITNSTVTGTLAGHGVNLPAGGMLLGNTISNNSDCGANFGTSPGTTGAIGENLFTGNASIGVLCPNGVPNQNQVQGNVTATSCNAVQCSVGVLKVGTFCPPATVACFP
ncbi:MAG: hypothetical protein U0900_15125 [Myxococcota bacterium]